MKCKYDECGFRGCLECDKPDCIRNDIKHDDVVIEEHLRKRERYKLGYEKWDAAYKERLRLKRLGLPLPEKHYKCKGREAEYQREYRAQMPEEQKERYRAWQREYARKKRAKIA